MLATIRYSFWRNKNLPVSSDLKPPLGSNQMLFTSGKNTEFLKGCAIFHKIPTLRLHFTFHTISKHKSCNISFEQTDVKWAFAEIYHLFAIMYICWYVSSLYFTEGNRCRYRDRDRKFIYCHFLRFIDSIVLDGK